MVSKEWITNLNTEFRAAGIEQQRRPWKAISRYSKDFNTTVDLSSDTAEFIFEWFKAHSKPRAHQIGNLYEGAYFYDSQFWLVSIPIGFGTFQLNALDCLHEMPEDTKQEMMADRMQAWEYVIYWANCLDYGAGIDDLRKTQNPNEFGTQLLMSADQELRSATSILSQLRPDPRAVLNCRMALEMFFKSYIALKVGLSETEARGIGHDLNKGLDRFIEVSELNYLEKTREHLKAFPEIHERYKEQDIAMRQLWDCYLFTQYIGAVITRKLTDRNVLEQVMAP